MWVCTARQRMSRMRNHDRSKPTPTPHLAVGREVGRDVGWTVVGVYVGLNKGLPVCPFGSDGFAVKGFKEGLPVCASAPNARKPNHTMRTMRLFMDEKDHASTGGNPRRKAARHDSMNVAESVDPGRRFSAEQRQRRARIDDRKHRRSRHQKTSDRQMTETSKHF